MRWWNADANTDGLADTYGDIYAHANGNSYSYTDSDGDSHSYANRNCNSNGDCNSHANADAYDPAAADTDAEAATYAGAASVGLTGFSKVGTRERGLASSPPASGSRIARTIGELCLPSGFSPEGPGSCGAKAFPTENFANFSEND